MKRSMSKAIFVFALACMPSLVHAQSQSQTPSVDFGRTTVQLSSTFVNAIQGLGAVITDLHNNPLQNNSFTVRATGGALDLTTSAGEVQHTGGLLVNAGGAVIRIQNLTIHTTNSTKLGFTADFVINDHFSFCISFFHLHTPPGLLLPLQLP